jgi:hypothetical protein
MAVEKCGFEIHALGSIATPGVSGLPSIKLKRF